MVVPAAATTQRISAPKQAAPPIGVVHLGSFTATAKEAWELYGPNSHQQPDYKVTITGTSCTDLASSIVVNSCQVNGTAYFYIDTEVVNGHKVKTCLPENNANGENLGATYTPSFQHSAFNPSGNAYLSPAYDDDQALPAHSPAHFQFMATVQPDSHAYTIIIQGRGAAGLRACSNTTDKNITGEIYLVAAD